MKTKLILGSILFVCVSFISCGSPSACDCAKNVTKFGTSDFNHSLQEECAQYFLKDGTGREKWVKEFENCQ